MRSRRADTKEFERLSLGDGFLIDMYGGLEFLKVQCVRYKGIY